MNDEDREKVIIALEKKGYKNIQFEGGFIVVIDENGDIKKMDIKSVKMTFLLTGKF